MLTNTCRTCEHLTYGTICRELRDGTGMNLRGDNFTRENPRVDSLDGLCKSYTLVRKPDGTRNLEFSYKPYNPHTRSCVQRMYEFFVRL